MKMAQHLEKIFKKYLSVNEDGTTLTLSKKKEKDLSQKRQIC